MKLMKASRRPLELLEELASPTQPPTSRMYRSGFENYLEQMPLIDCRNPNPEREVEVTRKIMSDLALALEKRLPELNLPNIPDGKFGRVILGLEDPKEGPGGKHPGTEIVLALWGNGFTSPVHGHSTGYIHEALINGSFDVSLYEPVSRPIDRVALLDKVIVQSKPGTFYSEFVQERGQEMRSALIHNFVAREPNTMSLHYLPEHVRDGSANRFTVVGSKLAGDFNVSESALSRVSFDEAMKSNVGDVYLVRSPKVESSKDHYVLISGGLVQKSHGLRPNDIVFPAPKNNPLRNFPTGELVLLKLNGSARESFYQHFNVHEDLMFGKKGLLPADTRF